MGIKTYYRLAYCPAGGKTRSNDLKLELPILGLIQSSNLGQSSSLRLWKWLANSSPIDGTALGQLSGKQFSPFMEMVSDHFMQPK